MRTLPAALITEKNKRESTYPWIFLLDIEIDASTWLYITDYDAIYEYWKTFQDDYTGDRTKIIFPHPSGSQYEYYPFQLGIVKETSVGSLEALNLTIDNSNRQMESYLHSYDLIGNEVILRIANLNYMASSSNQVIDYFRILGITSGRVVTFGLGHIGLIRKEFGRTITRACTFRFQDTYCGFAGSSAETCKRILGSISDSDTCKGKGNEERYGGFPNARGYVK